MLHAHGDQCLPSWILVQGQWSEVFRPLGCMLPYPKITLNLLTPGDTIVPGEYFYDGQNLISANGKFELGFFNPGDASNAYVGIWYHNITDKTALWVLNNLAPVTVSPGYLHLTDDGNLELCNASDMVIWFTGTPYGNNTIVRLADSGNFFLEDRDSNTTELQSFDYLTDTLIPGMKLGLDKVTNHATKLISWLNATDPYPGAYSCTMETRGTLPEIIITKGQSLRIFRSGPWNGHVFSGIPRMGNISQLKFAFLSNEQEVYFSFDTINNSGLFRAVMDFRGVFQLLEWSATSSGWTSLWAVPQDQCDFYAFCGANAICTETSSVLCQCLQGFVPKSPANWYQNHFSDGCVRQEALSCSSDGFLHLRSVKLPDTVNATTDSNMTLNECSDWCLKNCSCMAYAVTAWSGCLTWRGDLMDLRKFNQGGDQLYVRLLASNIDSAMDNHVKKTVLVITIPTMLSFLLLASICVVLWRSRVRKQDTIMIKSKQPQTTKGLDYWTGIPAKHADQRAGPMNMMGVLSSFDLSTIKAATNNFSVGNKLGEGGFGIVYKGGLRDGKYIAVKMLSKCSSQGPDEFRNELLLIANLQHRNLVRLLGCCIEGDERILILEYMENKSLDAFIYDKTKSVLLDWKKRLHIIIGIARGLLYLHHDSYLRVVHRDLKPSNILLDKDMNPKISDFGIARIFEGDDIEENNTTRPVGTLGYMAPEYITEGVFSFKSDVFSFGVIVLEILSGKRNRVLNVADSRLNLLGHAFKLWKEDRTLEILDEALDSWTPTLEILECIRVGLLCVQENSEDRPTMAEVVMMLTNEDPQLTSPKEPITLVASSEEERSSIIQMSVMDEICSDM
ncbi:unnamed protein product [Musa hybrid cultivar]